MGRRDSRYGNGPGTKRVIMNQSLLVIFVQIKDKRLLFYFF